MDRRRGGIGRHMLTETMIQAEKGEEPRSIFPLICIADLVASISDAAFVLTTTVSLSLTTPLTYQW
jgi:hypothetical protein